MISLNLALFLCIIYASFLTSDALLKESLVSGRQATPRILDYQLAVLGQANFTDQKDLVCGAGLIGKDKVLAVAQCFVDEEGNHRELTFSVVAGMEKLDLPTSEIDDISIALIYLMNQDPNYKDDIAVALLVQPFDDAKYPYLVPLNIPSRYQYFAMKLGTIAGYGYFKAETEFIGKGPRLRRIGGETDGLLRLLKVRVSHGIDCTIGNKVESDYNVICAEPINVPRGEFWGICQHDAGSPLVIEGMIAGIATSGRPDCDDTVFGGLYIKVSVYEHFINPILKDETLLDGTIIYTNRHHEV